MNFDIEDSYKISQIAGIDEAGRGPLAGPVVAAAVIVNRNNVIEGIADSKKLTKKKREDLYKQITTSYQYSVGIVSPEEIDEINILQATIKACRIAASQLADSKIFLVDGNMKFNNDKYISVVKGDNKSISIAAASIVAKVTRDRIMSSLHNDYPEYCWDSNSGYGSKVHIEAIKNFGMTPHHRRSFKPKSLE